MAVCFLGLEGPQQDLLSKVLSRGQKSSDMEFEKDHSGCRVATQLSGASCGRQGGQGGGWSIGPGQGGRGL